MKFVTVREFSRSPSKFISLSASGNDVVITRNGHPVALLSEFSEADIEDFILAKHFNLEKEYQKARTEFQKGKTIRLEELISDE